MMDEALHDRIEQYLLGQLSEEAAVRLESEMATDQALADQVVTAVGVGHTLGIDVPDAAGRVNASNWSKFVDGQPVFDENGKIAKGPSYQPVDLEGLF